MQDLFFHLQHSARKPQYSDSYRVRDNDRGITPQTHFSGLREQHGSIQENRLQLKFHADMGIKRHSLNYPNYLQVGFTSASVSGKHQNFNRI
jgi:hypothetical protein